MERHHIVKQVYQAVTKRHASKTKLLPERVANLSRKGGLGAELYGVVVPADLG